MRVKTRFEKISHDISVKKKKKKKKKTLTATEYAVLIRRRASPYYSGVCPDRGKIPELCSMLLGILGGYQGSDGSWLIDLFYGVGVHVRTGKQPRFYWTRSL